MAIIGRNFEIEDLGGGKFRSTINLKPSAYFESGSWRRMTLDFLDSGIIERPHLVTAAPMMVTVAPDGLRRLHPTRELDRYLEIGAPFIKIGGVWQKAPLGAPVRSANLLNWTTANANMYVAHGGHFVKLAILLKNGWQPEGGQFAFPVGISGLTRSGGQILADGVPVANLRAPHVEDLDDPEDVRPVAWQFVNLSGQPYVLFTLPSLAGMSRPLIDPTLTLQPDATDGLDTDMQSNAPTTNYGTLNNLRHGKYNTPIWRHLLKFDVSSIPPTATVDSALMSLWMFAAAVINSTVQYYRVRRAWTEMGATWVTYDGTNNWGTAGCGNTTNDREGTGIGSASVATTDALGTQKNVTLTASAVEGWVSGSFANNGLCGINDEESVNSSGQICSSDHATAGYRPKLVVNYTEAGGVWPLPQRVVNQAGNRASTY